MSTIAQIEHIHRNTDISKMKWGRVATQMSHEWYGTTEAIRVAENVLISQKDIGGWIKNHPYHHELSDSLKNNFIETKGEIGGTFDNGATIMEMRFLSKVFSNSKDKRYSEAFYRGLNYIFISQYDNGGWPQFYPRRDINDETLSDRVVPYSMHITYNDEAIVNIMRLLEDVFKDSPEFADLYFSDAIKKKAKYAFDKGIECILNTQIIVDGKPTVWCAQHDFITLLPVKARSYELESFSGAESVGIVLLLMDIEKPSKPVIDAINGAVEWFDSNKIEGIRLSYELNSNNERDRVVISDKDATPIWARFYDLDTGKPYFCSRDGIKRELLSEISYERRNGYSWYTNRPDEIFDRYDNWINRLNE